MTLREWLEESEAKGYRMRPIQIPASSGEHFWKTEYTSAAEAITIMDSAGLESPVRLIELNELYRESGKRGVIAETLNEARWIRFEPYTDVATSAS